jgi:hypothetical protein
MEAGINDILIASPIPAFASWNVEDHRQHYDEWHTYLRQLSHDAGCGLPSGGRQRAEIREMSYLGPAWLSLIEKASAEAGAKN